MGPCAHRYDGRAGLDRAAIGDHPHKTRARFDRSHGFSAANVRACGAREREVGCNRRLGFEKAAIRLEDGDVVPRQPESREAPHQLRRRQQLVLQFVKAGRGQCSLHQSAGGRADLCDARHVEQAPAGCCFELAP